MSWVPQDIVADYVNVYLDWLTSYSEEDAIWSKKVNYEPLPRAESKGCHDAGMVNKVSRLRQDDPKLPVIARILRDLPVEQYSAILAAHYYVGLNAEAADFKWKDGKAWTPAQRAAKVGQSESEYNVNLTAAKSAVFNQLRRVA